MYPDGYNDEKGWTNFSQYLWYFDVAVANGNIVNAVRAQQVENFAAFCADFYVVEDRGLVRECSYNNATKGAERCVRVRNVQKEKNRWFKTFVVASIAIVCVKELIKLLVVLFVWLCAASRELNPFELVLCGESPFLLWLLWRRPSFLRELLLSSRTWKSHLLVFFVEDVFESVNQIALVSYFALRVEQQGIAFGIMFSLFVSALKLMKTGFSVITAWQRDRVGNARVHVADDGTEGTD